ncbi:aprataxin and PNK-like factor isoform X2 [Bicyclus anynana]|uniref:Aprataxin and PNK-like factor isoform X2 n=1 Tax=Bicyclus anynana TaxID=110368 RepID=A0A6J1P833_BICAN|nr:aprataxin and PNK-like factor isoform X2 [Bicyclus anynana]
MFLELVRIDGKYHCKIQIRPGEHVIGRDRLLVCGDKRMAHDHMKLNVNDDSLTITALHKNPCFYKEGIKETQILEQNNTVTLHNGDSFGLLPGTFWYKVVFCSVLDTSNNCECEQNTEEFCVENNNRTTSSETNSDETNTCDFNSDQGFDTETSNIQSSSLIAPESNDLTQGLNTDPTMQSASDKSGESSAISPKKQEPELQNDPNLQNDANVPTGPNLRNDPSIPNDPAVSPNIVNSNKRSHSQDNIDVKKIKIEPVEVKTERSDDISGPSLNRDQGTQTANGVNAATSTNNPPLRRERCMYGANCYSHPRDADWGPGERGVCPYGDACVKTDPRHWRDHEHPPGKLPPPPPGVQVVHRHGNVFYINAQSVYFYDDHFRVEDTDGGSGDFNYEN